MMLLSVPEGTELPSGLGKPMAGAQVLKHWGTWHTDPRTAGGSWEHSPLTSVHACYFLSVLWASMVQICFLLIWVTDGSHTASPVGPTEES